jgi:hypothetical protein
MRAVAQSREGFPGGVRQCSGKRRVRSIRPFRGTRKGREIEGDNVTTAIYARKSTDHPAPATSEQRSLEKSR